METRKRKIGEGDQGVVYLEWHAGKLYAVKTFYAIEGTVNHQKAQLETWILQQVKHPNLITTQAVTTVTKSTQLAVSNSRNYQSVKIPAIEIEYKAFMGYCSYGTLEKYYQKLFHDTSLQDIAIDIFRQILTGLDYLHRNNIVHGSLRFPNIFFDSSGLVRIGDFGDAEVIDPAKPVFGVIMKDRYASTTAKTHPSDDIRFYIRPTKAHKLTPYHFLSAFGEDEIEEDEIGLLSIFRKLFRMDASKLHEFNGSASDEKIVVHPGSPEAFYNCMVNIAVLRLHLEPATEGLSLCSYLLQHPFFRRGVRDEKTIQKQKQILFGEESVLTRAVRTPLSQIYSPLGFKKRLARERAAQRLGEIKKTPRPFVGFQESLAEFPLREITLEECKVFEEKKQEFLGYLQDIGRPEMLADSIRFSSETYELMRPNGSPSVPLTLFASSGEKTSLQKLKEECWEITRIYGEEEPAIASIKKTVRAYVAIQPKNRDIDRRKIIISFMGAEALPRLPESWWTNDCENQAAIWGKINFVRSEEKHTGIERYANELIEKIERELAKKFSSADLKNVRFELNGYSTGGTLAIQVARHFRKHYATATIHAILFATPAFMTRKECQALVREFPNNRQHAIFNLIALDDPALNIYGKDFCQPEPHTIFIVPRNFSGKSFLGISAASAGTTKAYIRNHSIKNYENRVAQLLNQAVPISRMRSRL